MNGPTFATSPFSSADEITLSPVSSPSEVNWVFFSAISGVCITAACGANTFLRFKIVFMTVFFCDIVDCIFVGVTDSFGCPLKNNDSSTLPPRPTGDATNSNVATANKNTRICICIGKRQVKVKTTDFEGVKLYEDTTSQQLQEHPTGPT